ncbi:MAG: hypothetical protein JZU64_15820 [Rhodoferax sp.]|nr:hypothetical protein [Rhodoferax sp.]
MHTNISSQLLALLGISSSDPIFRKMLISMGIYALPQTVEELRVEEEFDSDTDVEYELAKLSRQSQIVQIERLGVCLIYMTATEYAMSYESAPDGADFVLEQVAFYAAGVQNFMAFKGALPFGLTFEQRLANSPPQELGRLVAKRTLYDCLGCLYMPQDWVVNVAYDPDSGAMLHVHVRKQKPFDQCFLGKRAGQFANQTYKSQADCLGRLITDPSVQAIFEDLGVDVEKRDSRLCPEEIADAELRRGITLHIRGPKQAGIKSSLGKVVFVFAGVVYKRRGDLASQGYSGTLPYNLAFWNSPEQVLQAVPHKPIWTNTSDQLISYMWRTENGQLLQAVCSLIDWQLYRLMIWAPFMSTEFGLK